MENLGEYVKIAFTIFIAIIIVLSIGCYLAGCAPDPDMLKDKGDYEPPYATKIAQTARNYLWRFVDEQHNMVCYMFVDDLMCFQE